MTEATRHNRHRCSICRKRWSVPRHDQRWFMEDTTGRRRWLHFCDECWEIADTEAAQDNDQDDT
jgi:hypothetical protein